MGWQTSYQHLSHQDNRPRNRAVTQQPFRQLNQVINHHQRQQHSPVQFQVNNRLGALHCSHLVNQANNQLQCPLASHQYNQHPGQQYSQQIDQLCNHLIDRLRSPYHDRRVSLAANHRHNHRRSPAPSRLGNQHHSRRLVPRYNLRISPVVNH